MRFSLRLSVGLLFALLATGPSAWAQTVPGFPPAPAPQAEPPKDALGRDTPRGTVLGFMIAARKGTDDISPLYLDTTEKGEAAVELAHKLYVVLDSRLPARLNELSDRREGAPSNPLKPDQNVVGTINTANGARDVVVERVTQEKSAPVWLFSRETLSFIPDAYDEIDLVRLDRFIPDVLARPRIAGIRLFEWLVLVFILPLGYRVLGALTWFFGPVMAFLRRRTGATDGEVTGQVPGLVRLVIMGIAIRWAIVSIDLPLLERQFWTTVSALLLIVALGWFLLLLNGYGEEYVRRRFASGREAAAPLRLARGFADVLAVSACVLATLGYFGFNPTAALAGFGIGGIAVALAAQKTLENVIAGLSLIFDKAVQVGDTLKFGDTVGTVDAVGLRSTRIRTLDRTVLSVPNGQIASTGIETLSARDKFLFRHVVGLRGETTADQMRSVIEGVSRLLLAHGSVEHATVRVRFIRLGAPSLDVEVFAYVLTGDLERFLEIQQELLLGVMETVAGAGTAIAFPSQTLHLAEGRVPGLHAQAARGEGYRGNS